MAEKPYSGPAYAMKGTGASVTERAEYPVQEITPQSLIEVLRGLHDPHQPQSSSRQRLTPTEADNLYITLLRLKEQFSNLSEAAREPFEDRFYTMYGDLELLCEEDREAPC